MVPLDEVAPVRQAQRLERDQAQAAVRDDHELVGLGENALGRAQEDLEEPARERFTPRALQSRRSPERQELPVLGQQRAEDGGTQHDAREHRGVATASLRSPWRRLLRGLGLERIGLNAGARRDDRDGILPVDVDEADDRLPRRQVATERLDPDRRGFRSLAARADLLRQVASLDPFARVEDAAGVAVQEVEQHQPAVGREPGHERRRTILVLRGQPEPLVEGDRVQEVALRLVVIARSERDGAKVVEGDRLLGCRACRAGELQRSQVRLPRSRKLASHLSRGAEVDPGPDRRVPVTQALGEGETLPEVLLGLLRLVPAEEGGPELVLDPKPVAVAAEARRDLERTLVVQDRGVDVVAVALRAAQELEAGDDLILELMSLGERERLLAHDEGAVGAVPGQLQDAEAGQCRSGVLRVIGAAEEPQAVLVRRLGLVVLPVCREHLREMQLRGCLDEAQPRTTGAVESRLELRSRLVVLPLRDVDETEIDGRARDARLVAGLLERGQGLEIGGLRLAQASCDQMEVGDVAEGLRSIPGARSLVPEHLLILLHRLRVASHALEHHPQVAEETRQGSREVVRLRQAQPLLEARLRVGQARVGELDETQLLEGHDRLRPGAERAPEPARRLEPRHGLVRPPQSREARAQGRPVAGQVRPAGIAEQGVDRGRTFEERRGLGQISLADQ